MPFLYFEDGRAWKRREFIGKCLRTPEAEARAHAEMVLTTAADFADGGRLYLVHGIKSKPKTRERTK